MDEPSAAQDPRRPDHPVEPTGAIADVPIRFFLVADVRGYSTFTHRRGDEAAAQLAARFADVTRNAVAEHGGNVLELRGDEALVVFSSARGMLRGGLALQRAYVTATLDDANLPLPVGIGMDAGEAVAVEGGFRGSALNVAARLCSLAQAGEVLASSEVTHLAGHLEGVTHRARGRQHVKGIDDPVTVIALQDTHADAERSREFRAVLAASSGNGKRRPRSMAQWVTIVAAGLVLVLAVGFVVDRRVSARPSTIPGGGVTVLDAKSGHVIASIPTGEQPGALAYGADSVWVADASSGSVVRINPTTHQVVDRIQVGGAPAGLAVANGIVWVADGTGHSLAEIDPDVGTVVHRIGVGNEPIGIASGPGAVWVANSADATISRIDPVHGKVVRTVSVGGDPTGVSVGSSAVWVTDGRDDAVTSVDPATGTRQTFQVGSQPIGVAAAGDGVWVANSLSNSISRLDPASDATETISLPAGPESIAETGDGGVWATEPGQRRLVRIDPTQRRVDEEIAVAGIPHALLVVGDELWVSAAESGDGHRGGTLKVMTNPFPSGFGASLDPSVVYDAGMTRLLLMTSDGLIDYQRAAGAPGATLVPDLATRIPLAEDGGKTYTFQLRPGINYSNGVPLRASDFRRALERNFTVMTAPAGYLYSHLKGAAACLAHRQESFSRVSPTRAVMQRPVPTCDLSQGVQTDNAAGTVTFHLTSADPDFLYKLAMHFADAVPAGTSRRMVTGAIPGTGPYMVSSFHPGQSIVLIRNPNFHLWSAAAQPDGYPNEIVFLPGTPHEALAMVTGHTADLTDYLPPGQVGRVKSKYPAQVHVTLSPYVQYLALDASRPPFKNQYARQAFATVVDRDRMAALLGAQFPTCSLLPPGTEGFSSACPTSDGGWASAHALMRRSGTVGDRVSVIWPAELQGGDYVRHLLARLGYHVDLQPDSYSDAYFGLAFKRDVSQQGWAADYPSPSGYLDVMLSCKYAVHRGSAWNVGHYCSPALDAAIRHAQRLQVSQPALAGRAWATADRMAVADAAVIPTGMSEDLVLTSSRVHNFQTQPAFGVLIDQLWVL